MRVQYYDVLKAIADNINADRNHNICSECLHECRSGTRCARIRSGVGKRSQRNVGRVLR